MHVPTDRSEDLEAVREDTNLVEVSHLNLAETCVRTGSVHPVELVNDAFIIELLDDSDGLLADGRFSLLRAGSAVMGAIDAWVLRDFMLPVICGLH